MHQTELNTILLQTHQNANTIMTKYNAKIQSNLRGRLVKVM